VKVQAGRWFVLVSLLVLAGCADSKEVNAAFSRTRVSWLAFDPDQSGGLRPLTGFEQPLKVTWTPRTRAVVATDLAPAPENGGAVAVSRLGLLVLDDSTGSLEALRPDAQWPLSFYETDRVFAWKGRLFLTLRQEAVEAPPASLAWWIPGQTRLAFYPVPSQIRDAARQAAAFEPPTAGRPELKIYWKRPQGMGWAYDTTSLTLDTGAETPGGATEVPPAEAPPARPGPQFAAERERLAERLGDGLLMRQAEGAGPLLLFTEGGWVAVGRPGEEARLYRLPELGPSGRYTGALGLSHGFVFTWETSFRGYVGAAGLVHVPFAVLAP
jgi:hypothetical protein